MFRTAATKIAHNSTIPALAGNHDLRPLQDLITAEKTVLVSLQRLSADITKASEALRSWGLGEGDDLGDTLSASTTVLAHFASALTHYATLEHTIRDNMKAVRTREERLDDLKRRRKNVVSRADTAERKLNKMSPEHKNLSAQTDMLNRLRDEIRSMDTDIMAEESDLGDFKRKCTKNWMTLKFGGLAECCEKGAIVGELGKDILTEIPDDVTQPGLPRSYYSGQSRVNSHVAEIQRRIGQVVFSGTPSSSPDGETGSTLLSDPSANPPSTPLHLASPEFNSDSNTYLTSAPILNMTSTAPNRRNSIDELGSRSPSSSDYPNSRLGGNSTGSQFASLPSRGNRGGNMLQDDTLSLGPGRRSSRIEDSFSSSIADALSSRDYSLSMATPDDFVRGSSMDEPVPEYEPIASSSFNMPLGLPSGAAPPTINAYDQDFEEHTQRGSFDERESQLPYASPVSNEQSHHADRRVRFGAASDDEPETPHSPEVTDGRETGQTEQEEPYLRSASPVLSEERRVPRIPPPMMDTEEDEKARNAAAAREVTREMDALTFSPLLKNPAYSRPQLSTQPPVDQPDYTPRSVTTSPIPSSPNVSSLMPASPTGFASRSVSPAASADAPYRTPPEYPKPFSSIAPNAMAARSTSSLTTAQFPGGARTISAAAFRRPQPRVASGSDASIGGLGGPGGPADTSPLTFRKRALPTTPGNAGTATPQGERSLPPGQSRPVSSFADEEDFDYISAYVNANPEPGEQSRPSGEYPPGYAQGRFATNLEGNGRRS
ncbi:hypothetical protein SERLA73DRAFT_77862 [Serpula lacrymans var. lacrymans S7.3]|uniref:Eisosome component PIL1-domain-containing protein n=1 Tax=Serpula lacrymans var. lacrymans (strain S7.3) TaxID=936435 RepID=F8QB85_SERL3|nr:hypothetical protein SERLA73DRAFT_77862 [Serpula lacrymans var. lacrymans S7.3]